MAVSGPCSAPTHRLPPAPCALPHPLPPALQMRYAGIQEFLPHFDLPALDAETELAGPSSGGSTSGGAQLGSNGGGASYAGGAPLCSPLPALAIEPEPAAFTPPGGATAASRASDVSPPLSSPLPPVDQLLAGLDAAQRQQVAALLAEGQRAQCERDAALYRLDELEEEACLLRVLQRGEQEVEASTVDGEGGGGGGSAQPQLPPLGSPPSSLAHSRWPDQHGAAPAAADGRVLQGLLAGLSAAADDLVAAGSDGGRGGSPAAQLCRLLAELEVWVAAQGDQAAAEAAAAEDATQLLAAERREQRQRQVSASVEQRAARQERMLLEQYIGELEVGGGHWALG